MKRLQLFPLTDVLVAVFGGLALLGLLAAYGPSLLAEFQNEGWLAVGVLALFVLGTVGYAATRVAERWVTVEIDAREVRYRQNLLNKTQIFPRSALRAVTIIRPRRGATEYWLELRHQDDNHRLLYGEHYLLGRAKFFQAQQLARDLNVVFHDPQGELWRASPIPPVRWLGYGDTWIVLAGLAGLALIMAAGLTLSR